MYTLELSKDYFKQLAAKPENVMSSADSLYLQFIKENVTAPLGLKGQPDSVRIMISGQKEHVDVYRNTDLAVYDLYFHIRSDKFILSFQRKSSAGTAEIEELLLSLQGHPAVLEVNDKDYFYFA